MPEHHHHHHIHFWINIVYVYVYVIFRLGCCPCPIQWGWQHQAMPNTSSLSISVLWVNPSQATITDISLDIFRPCLSRPSFTSGAGKRKVCDIYDTGGGTLTWPYHLSRPLRRTAVISLMPNFRSRETEDVSIWSLVPQIQQIMARSSRQSRFRSKIFGPHVSLPWSIAERTQAVYILLRTLEERCLEVRTGSSLLNFPQATQHLAAMALSQPPIMHSKLQPAIGWPDNGLKL